MEGLAIIIFQLDVWPDLNEMKIQNTNHSKTRWNKIKGN